VTEKVAELIGAKVIEEIKPYLEAGKIEIFTHTMLRNVHDVVSEYKQGTLYVDPDMKREYSWDTYKASKFIESVYLGLPITPILAVEVGEKKIVMDGFHRLETLRRYIDGEFVPRNVIEPLNGKKFKSLKPEEQSRFINRIFPVHIITIIKKDPTIDDATFEKIRLGLIFEEFRRINIVVQPLKFSQIVFCGLQTDSVKMIKEVAKMSEYKQLIGDLRPSEAKNFTHYMMLLNLGTCLFKKRLINVLGTGRMRRYSDLADFLFTSDKARLEAVRKEMTDLIKLAAEIGLTREYFVPQKYGSKTQTKLSQTLFLMIMWALRTVMLEVGRDKLVKASEKVRSAIENFFKTVMSTDSLRAELRLASHQGKQDSLEKLVSKLAEEIRKAVGA